SKTINTCPEVYRVKRKQDCKCPCHISGVAIHIVPCCDGMPLGLLERRASNGRHHKKACARCGHGRAHHHLESGRTRGTKRSECWFPGCLCKNFQTVERNTPN